MNINIIKEEIAKHLNKNVQINVYGLRNKFNQYIGTINSIYPNIFTIKTNQEEKSFTYADVITGTVKIKYLD